MTLPHTRSSSADRPVRVLGERGFLQGSQDYAEHRRSGCLYIDKTLFLSEFLKIFNDKASVITRPRRFGKSLLMSMVKYFLDESVDAEEAKPLFDGTLIVEDKALCAKHQQKYVVLHVDFKEIVGEDLEEFKSNFAATIRSLIEEIFDKGYVNSLKKWKAKGHVKELLSICEGLPYQDDIACYKRALKNLLDLFNQLKKPVIVLVDEYDHPLIDAYNKGYLDSARNLIQGFLSALKGGVYHKVLLTGVLRVSKDSMLSELNNLKTYDVMSDPYNRDFGFTEPEMELLYAKFPKITEKQREAVKDWYNGYSFGEDDVVTVYNPWAITSFLGSNNKRKKNHWITTGAIQLLQSIVAKNIEATVSLRENLLKFVADTTIPKTSIDQKHQLQINYDDAKFVFEDVETDPTMFWKLLLHAGYLTGEFLPDLEEANILLRAPNKEVLSEFSRLLRTCFTSVEHFISRPPFDNLYFDLPRMLSLYQSLNAVLKAVPSYWDILDERSLHAVVLGLAAASMPIPNLSSNREAGSGRPDLVIKRPNFHHAFLFEFKYVKTSAFADRSAPEVLFEAAQQAMAQMTDRDYVQSLAGEKGIEHLVYVGLAYGKKQVMMIYDVAPVSHTAEGLPVLGERETGRAFWDIGEYHPQEKVYLSSNQLQGWEDLELVEH